MTDDWLLLGLRLLAAALLYAFLAVAVYAVWRDVRAAARERETPLTDPTPPAAWLSVTAVSDPALSVAVGQTFPVAAPATVGRDHSNQIVLPHECVSARHARIERADGEWILTDLGSRNGTRLNNLPITRPTALADGDVIGIGAVELRFGCDN